MKLNQKQKELKKQIEMDVKMIFVIRTELKMGKGKIASQVGHCAIMLYKELLKKNNKNLLDAFENTGSKKIVTKLKTEKELNFLKKQAEKLNIINCTVQDAGKTQIACGSVTVIGFVGPAKLLNSFTKNLKLV